MKKAALYARVSSDKQKQEQTIESQVATLKQQIAAFGDTLVKEYIDEGHSGAELDRPALNELRSDAKGGTFEAIYFLDTDRIARDVAYQTIIIGELIKHGKQIIINGKDYVNNPENKFTLTVLGAVAELERAKILERMTRGRLHRLRQGQVTSQGQFIYGYRYVKKTPTAPASLVVNEDQATVVRSIFEMYASGQFGITAISRTLEQRGIVTRMGNPRWTKEQIKLVLENVTYTGTRYYNRMAVKYEPSKTGQRKKVRRWEYRDRSEWIPVKVPALVSQDLFDKVQERLRLTKKRYLQPPVQNLLRGLVECGECGWGYSAMRRYYKSIAASGETRIYEWSAYRCNWRARMGMHDRSKMDRCHNPQIAIHILDGKVFELIEQFLFDPAQLRRCMDRAAEPNEQGVSDELMRIANRAAACGEDRRTLIDRYLTGQLSSEQYIAASRDLDAEIQQLAQDKAAAGERPGATQLSDLADASIRQFCASARARFEACSGFDAKRQFIKDHIERIIFRDGIVTLVGSVPLPPISGEEAKLPFRVVGEIDRTAVRLKAARTSVTSRRTNALRRSLAIPRYQEPDV